MTVLELLRAHEWAWKLSSGGRGLVHCETCGAQHREETKVMKHGPGCEYSRLIRLLEDGTKLTGDSEV